MLEHHLLAFPPGTPQASTNPKVTFFPENKTCSCKTGLLHTLKLVGTAKTKGCSVIFPSPAFASAQRTEGTGSSHGPHAAISKNKIFLLLAKQGRKLLCSNKGRAADCIFILLTLDGFH